MVQQVHRAASRIKLHGEDKNLGTDVDVADAPDWMQADFILVLKFRYSDETHYKRLIEFSSGAKNDRLTSLMIACSMVCCVDSQFQTVLLPRLSDLSINVIRQHLNAFVKSYPELDPMDYIDTSKLADLKPPHYVFIYCILMNLLGKQLNTRNYSEWISRRLKTYAAPLGLSASDLRLRQLSPGQHFSAAFYAY